MGYRFAAALTGGDCALCGDCVAAAAAAGAEAGAASPPVARRGRPMEAVGIDVVRTAAAAGLPIEMPAADHPVWRPACCSSIERSRADASTRAFA